MTYNKTNVISDAHNLFHVLELAKTVFPVKFVMPLLEFTVTKDDFTTARLFEILEEKLKRRVMVFCYEGNYCG